MSEETEELERRHPRLLIQDRGASEDRTRRRAILERQKTRTVRTMRIAVFFDGTGCNLVNVFNGPRDGSKPGGLDADSYGQDYSNVGRLYLMWRPYAGVDISEALYIEGVGTTVGLDDDVAWDQSMGLGDTGLQARVDQAVEAVLGALLRLPFGDDGTARVADLKIDVFGFSRGAASARRFIHTLGHRGANLMFHPRLKGRVEIGRIRFPFMGLFDTVSAEGGIHSNDVRDLDLKTRWVDYVYHLCAAEEYRSNFPLVSVHSVTYSDTRRGRQVFLPGAHGDVGGSYVDRDALGELVLLEAGTPAVARAIVDNLVRDGWFARPELRLGPVAGRQANSVYGTRGRIRNTYSRIPLRLMRDEAAEHGVRFFRPRVVRLGVPRGFLTRIYRQIKAYDTSIQNVTASQPSDWKDKKSPPWQRLRHEFLHVSARYNTVVGLSPHKPRWEPPGVESALRERQVYRG